MKNEIFWLTLTIIITAVFWIPYILNRIAEHTLIPALRNPNRDARPQSQWANRMMYAHENAVENMVLFAPLVLAVHILGLSSSTTILAAMVYFYARVAHYLLYTFGIPYLRTIAFFVGFLSQMTLAYTIVESLI